MMIDKEKVRSRLKDAIMLLCHTDLHFASNVAVEGLLGITLDNKDIMLISIKETLKGDLDTSSRSEPGVDTELQGISITEGSLLDTPHVVQNSSPSVKRRPDRTRTRTEVPVEPEPEPITITMSPSPEREDERVTEPAYESPEPRRKRARLRQSRPGSDNLPIVSSANLPSTVSKNVSGIQKTEVFDVKPVWGSEEDTGDLEDTVGSLQTAGIGITPDESSGSMPYTEPPGGGHSETAVPLHVQQNIFANFPMKQEPYFHHSEPEPGPSGTSADHSFKKGMDSEEVIPAPWTWSSADGRSISLASTSNVASSSVFHQQQQQHTDQSFVIEKSNEDGDADIDAAYDSERQKARQHSSSDDDETSCPPKKSSSPSKQKRKGKGAQASAMPDLSILPEDAEWPVDTDMTVPHAFLPQIGAPFSVGGMENVRFSPTAASSRLTFTALDVQIKKILTEIQISLAEIWKELTAQRQLLMAIYEKGEQQPTQDGGEVFKLPDDVQFPLRCMEELDDLEGKLRDKKVLDALVRSFRTIGGTSIKEAVKRLLSHVLEHQLTLKLNWAGKSGWKSQGTDRKRAFGNLLLSTAVTKTVLQNALLIGVTEVEVQKEVMLWLRNAGDRHGGRKQRALRKNSALLTQEVEEQKPP